MVGRFMASDEMVAALVAANGCVPVAPLAPRAARSEGEIRTSAPGIEFT
jgi:hypothetical protein